MGVLADHNRTLYTADAAGPGGKHTNHVHTEAQRRKAKIVAGSAVNLHRTPLVVLSKMAEGHLRKQCTNTAWVV